MFDSMAFSRRVRLSMVELSFLREYECIDVGGAREMHHTPEGFSVERKIVTQNKE